MMYNIKTGWGGISKRSNEEIVVLVSSLSKLQEKGVRFVFTDRHAYLQAANFFGDARQLDRIDWDLLEARDFKRDPNNPGKFERYEAEALAYRYVPVDALLGVGCFDTTTQAAITAEVRAVAAPIVAVLRPEWYFR